MPSTTCNLFAILKDNSIRKIDLLQSITQSIKDVFIEAGLNLLNDDTIQILFDGNYAVQEEEILYVNLTLPPNIVDAVTNPIGINVLNLSTDSVKTLFWFDNEVYYFQNFDNRKLLQNKNVLFWDSNSYNKFSSNALIIENHVNAIFKEEKFYFNNFPNANKIFNLSEFYHEATDSEIDNFVSNNKISADAVWLKDKSNSVLKKQITLIQKSGVLDKTTPKKITTSASKFKLKINLDAHGKIMIPNNKKECKELLAFLNEQYFIGLLSKNKFLTNSKKSAN